MAQTSPQFATHDRAHRRFHPHPRAHTHAHTMYAMAPHATLAHAALTTHSTSKAPRGVLSRIVNSAPSSRAVRVVPRAASAPAGSALDALQAFSNVVLDAKKSVLDDARAGLDLGPKAGVVSASVLAMASRAGGRDAGALEGAMVYDKCDIVSAEPVKYECVIDKAMVNLAAMWAERVEGRVAVELFPTSMADDTDALLVKARHYANMARDLKIVPEKLLFKIPATYAGIEAVKTLEAEGISCHVSDVYCAEQARAAIDANATVVQLYYSRVNAWHKANPGKTTSADPGYDLARDALAYARARKAKTKIMVASLHNKDAVLRVLGVDYVLVSQRIIDEMANAPASDVGETIISDAPSSSSSSTAALSKKEFDDALANSPAKTELAIARRRNAAADGDLMNYIKEKTVGLNV